MFTRYTPAAVQCAGSVRVHAMQRAAATVGVSHLALALLDTSPMLFGCLTAEEAARVRSELDPSAPALRSGMAFTFAGGGSPPGLDDALTRAIDRSAADAASLGHPRIAPEHLLSALLAERDTACVETLARFGVTRERVLGDLQSGRIRVPHVHLPTRQGLEERLRGWIASLPDESLGTVEMIVEASTYRPAIEPHVPPPQPDAPLWASPPWGFPWFPGRDARSRPGFSSRSSSRTEDGTHVVETRRTIRGHEIVTVERFRLSDDGRTVSYSQEVKGPKATTVRVLDVDVS
jgi:hypothetical protein